MKCTFCDSDHHHIYDCISDKAYKLSLECIQCAKDALSKNNESLFVQWLNNRTREELIILTNHKIPHFRELAPDTCFIGYCVTYYYYNLAMASNGGNHMDHLHCKSIVYWNNIAGGCSHETSQENAEIFYKRMDATKALHQPVKYKEPSIVLYKYMDYQHSNCESNTECPICYESKSKKECIYLMCGHALCESCLKCMFAKSQWRSCPCCRNNVYQIVVYDECLKNRLRICSKK